jgi:hypothetical protein
MAVKYSKWFKTCQHFPFQGPPEFTQIGIFGLKINYLATLAETANSLDNVGMQFLEFLVHIKRYFWGRVTFKVSRLLFVFFHSNLRMHIL